MTCSCYLALCCAKKKGSQPPAESGLGTNQTADGFGLSIVEAISAHLPVVATNVGGIPDVVEDGKTGILVQPEDFEAMARTLEGLLRDSDLARQKGGAGRRRRRYNACFAEQVVWPQWEAIYERLNKDDDVDVAEEQA